MWPAVELGQPAAAAAGVVHDQDVDVPERCARRGDDRGRGGGVGEVRGDVLHPAAVGGEGGHHPVDAERVCLPRLAGVVSGEGVHAHRGAEVQQAAGDGEADAGPPAGAGDDGHTAVKR